MIGSIKIMAAQSEPAASQQWALVRAVTHKEVASLDQTKISSAQSLQQPDKTVARIDDLCL
jgi:hypothetical protein